MNYLRLRKQKLIDTLKFTENLKPGTPPHMFINIHSLFSRWSITRRHSEMLEEGNLRSGNYMTKH